MAAKTAIKVEMTKKKETKGTVVFENQTDGAPVSSLYVLKSALGESKPEKITVEISA